MKIKKVIGRTSAILCLVILYNNMIVAQLKSIYKVTSPDKSTVMETGINGDNCLHYRILFKGSKVIDWSLLGLTTNEEKSIRVKSIEIKSNIFTNEKFAWLFGERDSIENNYRQIVLCCTSERLKYDLIVRAYNGSIAFRYQLLSGDTSQKLKSEATEFRLSGNYLLYQYNQESIFTPTAIDTFTRTCDFPATLTSNKSYISIGESSNDNFTKAELKKGAKPNSLIIAYPRDTSLSNVSLTPWRSVSISKTVIGLHTFSDLNLRLSPASTNELSVSVTPGKLIRAQLTTESGLDCIDFAASHNFQYILYDAGWYGAEFRTTSDPTQVISAIDLPKVIAYGKQKKIGVILYVNYVGLRQKLDTVLPLYRQWGVAGLKFGFVDGLTQHGISWLADAIRKANDFGFILDIHDNYKPTGLSRTYPALFTQEGIRGDENSPDAFHNTTLPFTRFLAGAADFTFCFPNAFNSYSKNIKVSKAQQLALTVIFYSPLQSIFWYGRPKEYTNEDEIEFFKMVPTVWNETYYLAGDIGKNIAVARKHINAWYIGCATGFENWNTKIKMNFLEGNKTYKAIIFEDDEKGGIRKRIISIHKNEMLPVAIKEKGGMAVKIEEE